MASTAHRYQPLARLASGGMAEIWLGRLVGEVGFERVVVLKRAVGGDEGQRGRAKQALVEEARVTGQLSHPNVVHVYDLVEHRGSLSLVMEHIHGVSLRLLMEHTENDEVPVPWAIAARVVADAAQGLAYAHSAKDLRGRPLHIVHRDVTPENLFIAEAGIAKVMDFGIARNAMRPETRSGVVKGKMAYLSPEQIKGQTLDWRSDVFSLGVVAYELLVGRSLFQRADPVETMTAVLRMPVPPLPDSVPDVVRDLVRRMMVRDVARRRITMDEVAESLDVVATTRGGTQRQLHALIRSELGARLDQRRSRLAALLRGESPRVSLGERDGAPTGTMVSVEEALDGSPRRLDRSMRFDNEDTTVD